MTTVVYNSPALQCVEALRTILESVPELTKRVLFSTNEMTLMDNIKGVKALPAVGVLYEGMRALPDPGGSTRIGGAAEAVFAVVLINRDTDIVSTDQTRKMSVELLDDIRNKIMDTRSPMGHKWRFVVEAAADEKNGVVFWIQRWSTPIMLTGRSG